MGNFNGEEEEGKGAKQLKRSHCRRLVGEEITLSIYHQRTGDGGGLDMFW